MSQREVGTQRKKASQRTGDNHISLASQKTAVNQYVKAGQLYIETQLSLASQRRKGSQR